MFASESLILSGSNRNSRLWNTKGKFVGTFGQEKRWNLKNTPTFVHHKNKWSNIREERKDNKKKKASDKQPIFDVEQLFSIGEPLRDTEQEDPEKKHEISGERAKNCKIEPKNHPHGCASCHSNLIQVNVTKSESKNKEQDSQSTIGNGIKNDKESQLPRIDQRQLASPIHTPSEDMVQSQLTASQLNSIPCQRKHESLFKHNLEEGLLKRIAQRKVRRRVFGEINTQKVNQFGTTCSAFHALATTEMQNFTLPSDLPMTARMLSKGVVCTTESDLKSLQLSFPELDGEESGEQPSSSDKKNPLDQTKMPPLPPLISSPKSRLSQIRKSKSCHLPSVTTVFTSSSLKWGKY